MAGPLTTIALDNRTRPATDGTRGIALRCPVKIFSLSASTSSSSSSLDAITGRRRSQQSRFDELFGLRSSPTNQEEMPRQYGDLIPGRQTYRHGRLFLQSSERVFSPPSPRSPGTGLIRSPACLSLTIYRNNHLAPAIPRHRRRNLTATLSTEDPLRSPAIARVRRDPSSPNASTARIAELEARLATAAATEARLIRQLTAERAALDDATSSLTLARLNAHNLASQVGEQTDTIRQQRTDMDRLRDDRRSLLDDSQLYTTELLKLLEELQRTRSHLRTAHEMAVGAQKKYLKERKKRKQEIPLWAKATKHQWNSVAVGVQEAGAGGCAICGMDHGEDCGQEGGGWDDDGQDRNEWVVLVCGHGFHLGCIKKWHHSHLDCPCCRVKFDWRLAPLEEGTVVDDSSFSGVEMSVSSSESVDGRTTGVTTGDGVVASAAHGAGVLDIPQPTQGPWMPPTIPDRRLRTRVSRFWSRVTGRGPSN